MEVTRERVVGSVAVGDRDAHSKWEFSAPRGRVEDYESFFRDLMDNLANRGPLRIDGSLLFEFTPRVKAKAERLISPETSFCFHKMEEGVFYSNDDDKNVGTYKDSAFDSYHYQKEIPPLAVETMAGFMPVI